MTREEAIDIIKCLAWHTRPDEEDVEQAIKVLEQQPCEDCISRKSAIDAMIKLEQDDIECYGCAIPEGFNSTPAIEALNSLPSVTPKEKTGRWISFGIQGEIDGQIVRAFTCSKCGAISIFRVPNRNIVNGDLCPNCGAKMVEP